MSEKSTVNVQIGPQTRLMLGSGANSVIGCQLNFTQSPRIPRQVIVTPIGAAHTVTHTQGPSLIRKILIKVVKRDGKKAILKGVPPIQAETKEHPHFRNIGTCFGSANLLLCC